MIHLVFAVAAFQATASVSPPAPAANAATPPVQAAPVKKKRPKSCDTGEASLGSHIVMDTCPVKDDMATARDNTLFKRDQVVGNAPGAPH